MLYVYLSVWHNLAVYNGKTSIFTSYKLLLGRRVKVDFEDEVDFCYDIQLFYLIKYDDHLFLTAKQ